MPCPPGKAAHEALRTSVHTAGRAVAGHFHALAQRHDGDEGQVLVRRGHTDADRSRIHTRHEHDAARGPSPTPTPAPDSDYAGRTADDTAAVSVSVRDGKAIGYFCDGRSQESWLKGDVEDDGSMRLTGTNGARLDGVLRAGKIDGTVGIRDRTWKFTAAKAVRPSGLYRATAEVRGAKIDGGWIVLPDGRQVGILNRDGKPVAAPRIDPASGAVVVDGTRLTARPVVP